MRILILSQWFAPEPHFKGLPLAREFKLRGHEVVVLTGFPNYPGGKIYPGYRIKLWQWERLEGVDVLRVALYPSHSRIALARILNYASFALSATILGLLMIPQVDVAYVYHPPATIGLPALAFKWLRRVPCVYDVQDLWPDTLAATGMLRPGALLSVAGWWSNFVYKQMDRVVVLSPGFQRCLKERGVKPGAVTVIYNWSPDAGTSAGGMQLDAAEQALLSGRFNILFAGNLGLAQALETVVAAAAIVAANCPTAQFVFVGGGVALDSLQRLVRMRELNNVVFLPRRSPESMAPLYAAAAVLLAHLRNDPLFAITIPSKIQTYLAAGRPLLVAIHGDAARLVRDAGAGMACPPEQPAALAQCVQQFYHLPPAEREQMGERGRTFYAAALDRPIGVAGLLGQLQDAAAPFAAPMVI